MQKQNLTQAHQELFRRSPDERFESLAALMQHSQRQQEHSRDRWKLPQEISTDAAHGPLRLNIGSDGAFLMNDWSFSQLCSFARVNKETLNRLSAATAAQVFRETMPARNKPVQVLTSDETVRSIHGVSYTRLWNTDLLALLQEFATDFQPPQTAAGGGTGLYAGEQDMFVFVIDPAGWAEIEGEAFAPGVFLWNSEVGKRSVGISTFWFQAVCANHIVWDATCVTEFKRKHTANVRDALTGIRQTLEQLIEQRDRRRDSFVSVIEKAMKERLGSDAEEALKVLQREGIGRTLAKEALQIAQQKGAFTIFAVVDALTRLAARMPNAGDRLEVDQKAAALLELATA